MTNLLLFNLATDADDPILGFTTGWIAALAAHFDQIDVITMRAGRSAVPSNVHVFSVGKERGWGEARRAAEFYRLLTARLAARRYAACFAHMMPLFAVMGAPLLAARRIPITLWYTHRQPGRALQAAVRVSRRIVTAAPDSFPIPTPKLCPIGHGIDTTFFTPPPADYPRPDNAIVYVARIMPIKRQDVLIRAAADLPGASVVLVGDTPADVPAALAYRTDLDHLIAELGLSDRVTFAGPQTAEGVRRHLWGAAAAVNLSPVGLFDKAALEGLACGVPTVISNPAFDPVLGADAARLRVPADCPPADLAARLRDLLALSPADRAAIGARARANVVDQHSFAALIPRLVSVLRTGAP